MRAIPHDDRSEVIERVRQYALKRMGGDDLRAPPLVLAEHGEQLAARAPHDLEDRVERDVQAEPVPAELGLERLRDERHVVGDDLHGAVAAR